MSDYKVLSWPTSAVSYNTDSANDAWNWVMTSESPTSLYVVKSGRVIRPPAWFKKNEQEYDVTKFQIF